MHTILIVEDEISISNLYKLKLENHGFKVKQAFNGKDALAQLKMHVPDLILLDLLMPLMGGETFLERIRSQDTFKSIPVIVLTNISKQEAPRTLWHLGISDYFIKANHTPGELVTKISNHLPTKNL